MICVLDTHDPAAEKSCHIISPSSHKHRTLKTAATQENSCHCEGAGCFIIKTTSMFFSAESSALPASPFVWQKALSSFGNNDLNFIRVFISNSAQKVSKFSKFVPLCVSSDRFDALLRSCLFIPARHKRSLSQRSFPRPIPVSPTLLIKLRSVQVSFYLA